MNAEDKTSIPGYIYFRDNGMDYKIGLTNNLVVRGRAYKTENPRDTVVDYFQVETYAEAEAIEDEMKKAARAEGRCSFDNSDEWLVRTEDSVEFWGRFVKEYAKKTHDEWMLSGGDKALKEERDELIKMLLVAGMNYAEWQKEKAELKEENDQLRKKINQFSKSKVYVATATNIS